MAGDDAANASLRAAGYCAEAATTVGLQPYQIWEQTGHKSDVTLAQVETTQFILCITIISSKKILSFFDQMASTKGSWVYLFNKNLNRLPANAPSYLPLGDV